MVGVSEFRAAFVKVGAQADAAAQASVREGTVKFIGDAKRGFEGSHRRVQPHAGGEKPNIVTGHLRQSIRSQGIEHRGMGDWTAKAGPTMAYARRVELGFTGPDSLGRNINSRPFPYIEPAYNKLREALPGIIAANWSRIVI